MAENLFNKAHKATNPTFRQRYDEIEWDIKLYGGARGGGMDHFGIAQLKRQIIESKPIVDFRKQDD